MKKSVSVLIILLLCINILIPCYADNSSFVNDALISVLEKIEIPKNYTEFNNQITVGPDNKYVNLSWYGDGDDDNNGGQINITVDNKLRIVEFSQYFYGEYVGDYKLSKITQTDAERIATEFVSGMCPEFFPYIRLEVKPYGVNRNFEPYEVIFYRYENNIPCYDNYIIVNVNAHNEAVMHLKVNWEDYDKIYSPKTNLTLTDAKVNMFDKIGLILEYAVDDTGNFYTRYASLSDGENYINAYTGSVLNTGIVSAIGEYKNATSVQKNFNMRFTEDFDVSDCINAVYNMDYIPFDDTYVLVASYCLEDTYGKYAMLEYAASNGKTKSYIIDKEKQNVRYYYQDTGISEDNKKLDWQSCQRTAELFFRKYDPQFYKNCKLVNYNKGKNNYGEEIYYFNYSRMINGIVYDNNGVVIGVSCASGNVVSVNSGWDEIPVPSYSKSISKEDAFETYINTVDFKLQYVTCVNSKQEKELRPVYAVNPNDIPMYVNSITGELMDEKGAVLKDKVYGYKDIENDVSKSQIETLLACGIFDGTEYFKPNEDVNLCDFLLWVCRTVDCYQYNHISEISSELTEQGLVTYNELEENGPVTMEKGIKYIISYLGYGEIAELPDTYTTDFVDEGMISSELIGYAAIAKGLKIFEGNAFLPKENMKRNVAAQILYNMIIN